MLSMIARDMGRPETDVMLVEFFILWYYIMMFSRNYHNSLKLLHLFIARSELSTGQKLLFK